MDSAKTLEIKHLGNTVGVIQEGLTNIADKITASKNRVLEVRKYLWEESPRLVRDATDANELARGLLDLQRVEESLAFYFKEREKLERLKNSPYFARIDVKFEDSLETIYIGVNGFIHPKSYKNLIYDWRTPIASLFYDYSIGDASYVCDMGVVHGEIVLKRQFRIEKSEMLYMFDSSINIEDEMLQEILSQSTDGHMRDIVMTIQREQNRAIRDESHDLVVVWGPGGSGKTSIALHRIAYLLYRKRENLTAHNIVIFSPSDIFQDYISDVLPNLGEENVKQANFYSLATRILDFRDYRFEHDFDEYESLFEDGEDTIKKATVLFKSSREFLELLENFVSYLEDRFKDTPDFAFNGEIVLEGEEFYSCVKDKYSYLPFKKRLEKLERRLHALLEPIESKRQEEIYRHLSRVNSRGKSEIQLHKEAKRKALDESAGVKAQMARLIGFDLIREYDRLFNNPELFKRLSPCKLPTKIDDILAYTTKNLQDKYLLKEDLAALAFLKQRLETVVTTDSIKHVVIDEVQDYSALELKVISQAYLGATFTVLGDPNQALLDKGDSKDYVAKSLSFQDNNTIELYKSYRSTKEITMFSAALMGLGKRLEPVLRMGKKPTLILDQDKGRLIKLFKELSKKSYKNIAVITKTYKEAKEVAAKLEEAGYNRFFIVGKDTELLPSGVIILPVFLAKGLEFDVAIVLRSDSYNIGNQKLLYIACTRALHELYLFADKKGDLLDSADPQLYEIES
ncbi:MAG: RNA polymerase recycling motor HelD [Firmicutes bacterium]|nr:RNA polymerase recycling motor HelD [Bacillota bacterium]MDD4262915.1 RNA polymerase recycling motor HelD [Bacillota bacterium]